MADTDFAQLYEKDFYLWAEGQADALRARAGASNALDYERLADEVAGLGKTEWRVVRSFTLRILEHLYKLAWSRMDDPKPGWRAEIVRFRSDLEDALTPTIRQMVEDDLEKLHRKAAHGAALSFDSHEPDAPINESLRWSFAQILGEEDDPIA